MAIEAVLVGLISLGVKIWQKQPEEEFILVHSLRSFSSQLLGLMLLKIYGGGTDHVVELFRFR